MRENQFQLIEVWLKGHTEPMRIYLAPNMEAHELFRAIVQSDGPLFCLEDAVTHRHHIINAYEITHMSESFHENRPN